MIVPNAAMGVTDFVVVAGVPANPDSITAVLYRWVGSTRSASGVTVTPTAVGSDGEYKFTWTNGDWARTDELELVAIPVVSSVAYPATIWRSHGGVDAVMRGTDSVPNSTIADAYALLQLTDADVALTKSAMDTLSAMLPNTDFLAGAATDEGYAVLNTVGQEMVTAFNAMRVGNVFTAPALANAPTGSGGGDNTEVFDAIDSMKSLIAEWIALNIPSDVRGFPATIIGGTDVTVTLEVVDSNNDPITEIFGESVETVQWLFGMGTSARRARILGSVEWISDLLQITITRAETLDDDDGPRTWMIGCKLTSGELKWVKTGVTRLIGRQFAEPTTTTTGV